MYTVLIEVEFYDEENSNNKCSSFYVTCVRSLSEAVEIADEYWGPDLLSVKIKYLGSGRLIEVPKYSIEEIEQLNEN